MSQKKLITSALLRPGFLISIFVLLAGMMIVSALIELRSSREELLHLMHHQSESLLETLLLEIGRAHV